MTRDGGPEAGDPQGSVCFGWDVCCGDIEAPEVGIPQGSRDEGTGGVAVERAMPALPPL